MIELYLNYRLGNVMFQYAVARLLADGLGCSLATRSQTDPDVLLTEWFPNAPLRIDRNGYHAAAPAIELKYHWTQPNPPINLRQIILARPERILVDGFFETFRHVAPFQQHVRRMFDRPLPHRRERIAVHLRLGDVAHFTERVPEFIDLAIAVSRRHSTIPLVLVAETPDHPFARFALDRLKSAAHSDTTLVSHPDVIETFDYLRQSRVLVLTNSTLTWWVGFLSPHAAVYVGASARQPCAHRNLGLFFAERPENFTVVDLDQKGRTVGGLDYGFSHNLQQGLR